MDSTNPADSADANRSTEPVVSTDLGDVRGPIVAFDLGDRRIGVAVSDPEGRVAFGRDTVMRSGDTLPWRVLCAMIENEHAAGVVVGDPLHLDGSSGDRSRVSRAFAEELHTRCGLPVAMQDERLTSVQAQRELIAMRPTRGKKKRGDEDVDQVAAILILQAWLDRRRSRSSSSGGVLP